MICWTTAFVAALTIATPVEDFFGPEAFAVIEAPMEVTAYELAPSAPGISGNEDGIEVFTTRRVLPIDTGLSLALLFLADKTLRFDNRRECDFTPSHALRFEGLSHTVDVLISFKCTQVRFILMDRDERILFRKTEEFDGARRSVKRLVRRGLRGRPPAAVARRGRVR